MARTQVAAAVSAATKTLAINCERKAEKQLLGRKLRNRATSFTEVALFVF